MSNVEHLTAPATHFDSAADGTSAELEAAEPANSVAAAVELTARLRGLDLFERLAAIRAGIAGRMVFTSSFGLEDQAIAHALLSQELAIDIAVDMNGAAGPNVRRAVVALEKQGTSAKWKTKDESDVLELDTFDDSVTIRGSGIDVGGADFANGAPTGPATVSWRFGDDGTLTATYTGYLHLTNFHQGSGRVVIRAINSLTGRASATAEGDTHTAEDNGHHAYQDTLAVVSDVAELEVAMQSWVTDPETGQGSWTDVDSQTVNVAA